MDNLNPRKRRRLSSSSNGSSDDDDDLDRPYTRLVAPVPATQAATSREAISAPIVRASTRPGEENPLDVGNGSPELKASSTADHLGTSTEHKATRSISASSFESSPFRLNTIRALPASSNIDTMTLRDLLGHPLLKTCWAFNYLIDVDFVKDQFDPDIREQAELKVVHGSWRREDSNRAVIEDACQRHQNVKAICAWMPEAFGTHHTKALILFRHDDLAQIVICTANFIRQDWDMCQAIWQSPLLPLLSSPEKLPEDRSKIADVGQRFKFDLLSYFKAYGSRISELVDLLCQYDFSTVRAALIASVPKRQAIDADPRKVTIWGWPGLLQTLKQVSTISRQPHIVAQISSVASLGPTDKWLRSTLFTALGTSKSSIGPITPKHSIVFPTADDIRRSVHGYACGGSIHMKTETAQQAKQLSYLRPMLCHWGADPVDPSHTRDAGRRRAGPHIKTYLRFTDESMNRLDWALITSANLSKQAWGAETTAAGEIRICSYELGVLIYPDLWSDDGQTSVQMVPTFKTDMPDPSQQAVGEAGSPKFSRLCVGIRMPYDLPLVRYGANDQPWCNTCSHSQPDWLGSTWD